VTKEWYHIGDARNLVAAPLVISLAVCQRCSVPTLGYVVPYSRALAPEIQRVHGSDADGRRVYPVTRPVQEAAARAAEVAPSAF